MHSTTLFHIAVDTKSFLLSQQRCVPRENKEGKVGWFHCMPLQHFCFPDFTVHFILSSIMEFYGRGWKWNPAICPYLQWSWLAVIHCVPLQQDEVTVNWGKALAFTICKICSHAFSGDREVLAELVLAEPQSTLYYQKLPATLGMWFALLLKPNLFWFSSQMLSSWPMMLMRVQALSLPCALTFSRFAI